MFPKAYVKETKLRGSVKKNLLEGNKTGRVCSKTFAKETKLGGSAKNKEQRVRRVKEAWFLFFPPLPPSHSPHSHLSQILCSPRTCYFARLLFRLLVESSHGKGKEKTVTQAIIVLVRPWWWWKLGQILWIVLDKLFFFFHLLMLHLFSDQMVFIMSFTMLIFCRMRDCKLWQPLCGWDW